MSFMITYRCCPLPLVARTWPVQVVALAPTAILGFGRHLQAHGWQFSNTEHCISAVLKIRLLQHEVVK